MTETNNTSEDFFDAVEHNDFALAANILRALPGLQKYELELLANLFDPALPSSPIHPFRLKLVRRRGGKPVDFYALKVRDTAIHSMVTHLIKSGKSWKAAISIVSDKKKLSRSTVANAYSAGEKRSGQ